MNTKLLDACALVSVLSVAFLVGAALASGDVVYLSLALLIGFVAGLVCMEGI